MDGDDDCFSQPSEATDVEVEETGGDRFWPKEVLQNFIETYHRQKCLWKIRDPSYVNKNLRRRALDELVKVAKPIKPGATRDFVSKKIQSLRSSFRKEYRKVQRSTTSGTSPDEVYTPSLWYYDLLMFTIDHSDHTESVCSLPGPSYSSVLVPSETSPDKDERGISNITEAPPAKKVKRKHVQLDPASELVKLACQRLGEPQDDSHKIAAAWAVELRKMDPHQQMFAKKAINDILFEGQMGTLHRDSVSINSYQLPPSRASTPQHSVQSIPSTISIKWECDEESVTD